jgi:hypothetical protein
LRYGASLAGIGDINDDGRDDVAIGCEQWGGSLGRVYIYSGADLTSAYQIIDGYHGLFAAGTDRTIAGGGDVNADGYSDLVIGAYAFQDAVVGSGRAYVYLLGRMHSGVSPAENETDVPIDINITVSFCEDMDPSTFGNSTVLIDGEVSGFHDHVLSYDDYSFVLTVDPNEDFAQGETVTVELTTAIEMLGGTPLPANVVWSFTTERPMPFVGSVAWDMYGTDVAGGADSTMTGGLT